MKSSDTHRFFAPGDVMLESPYFADHSRFLWIMDLWILKLLGCSLNGLDRVR